MSTLSIISVIADVVYRFQDFRNVEDSESTLPYATLPYVADEGDSGREEGHPLEEVDGGDGLVKGSRKRLLSSDDESDNVSADNNNNDDFIMM